MYRVIIWGTGRDYNHYCNSIKLQELSGKIQITGITGKEKLYDCLDGYKYIERNLIKSYETDYIIAATGRYFDEIVTECENMGFDREHVLPVRVFSLPCFDFEEYVKLLHSHISIFANDCWGGLTYHSLAMQFRSPLINMFELADDYLRLLSDLKNYLALSLKFDRWEYEKNGDPYPVCKLGDIDLFFNHYKSMEDVEAKWYDRVGRVNYNNLFFMMFTENEEILKKFAELPYQKKVCFVPFESKYECACTIRCADRKPEEPFWRLVNGIPRGIYSDYDIISLLNSGRVNHKRVLTDSRDET